MRAAAVACVVVLGLTGGCSLGGDDDGEDDDQDRSTEDVCLVDPGRVAELLGYEVAVIESPRGEHECRFEPVDEDAHPGSEVVVATRELALEDGEVDEAYDAVVAAVESDAGPTQVLSGSDVDHADEGWVAVIGRAVQVGAVRDRRLVQVTVVDATLDADAAQAIAEDLAGQALG